MLSLSEVPGNVIVPRYDRSKLRTRIAHIGFGAFHRAHQAVCADRMAAEAGSDWGYCEINLIGGEPQITDINAQQCLWTVSEMADDNRPVRIVGVAKRALHAQTDGMVAVLDALCEPDIAIVSITVTEKGYYHHPASVQLNTDHPMVQHDLAHSDTPHSLPGVILVAIRRRRAQGLRLFTVMSCDNMPENGYVIRNVITQLAALQDEALAAWIGEQISFPSTIVDRIVPSLRRKRSPPLPAGTGCGCIAV